MAKLNQVIAVRDGTKPRVYAEISNLDKIAQKPELFNGFSKTYQPKEEGGTVLPPERKRVQYTTETVLRTVAALSTELFDITARTDWTNCHAKAAVLLDGTEILPPAPVSFLLFLEKQLTDLRTMVGRMPLLDDAEEWAHDGQAGLWKTEATQTIRTKKVPKVITLVQPTEQHPGQAQVYPEDVPEGVWNAVKMSGAMEKPARDAMLARIEKLLLAVKTAREEANMHEEVAVPKVGDAVFTYLLGGA